MAKDNETKKWVYDTMTENGYDLGSYDEFLQHADDEATRKWLYEHGKSAGLELGDYEQFSEGMGMRQSSVINQNPVSNGEGFDAVERMKKLIGQNQVVEHAKTLRDIVKEKQNPGKQEDKTPVAGYHEMVRGEHRDYRPPIQDPIKIDVAKQNEERRIDSLFKPKEVSTDTDIFDNYRVRFSNTERGIELDKERTQIQDEVVASYMEEFKQSPEYKEIASKQYNTQEEADAANDKLNELFNAKYGEVIEKEMRPYNDAMTDEMFARYGQRINDDMLQLNKKSTKQQVSELAGNVDKLLDDNDKKLKQRGGIGSNAMNALMGSTRYNVVSADDRKEKGTLQAAKKLLEQSQNIIDEAGKKGKTNFFAGLGRGLYDNTTWDNYTFGLAEMADGKHLLSALEKADRGEELTEAEEALLSASAVNMVTQAYFSQDLGRGYKAGETTAVSIPFMLEFVANPISSSGNAIAKGLLKYGLKKLGSAATTKGAKIAGRLIGDATAAAGMTATTSAPRVAAGAIDRLSDNYIYGLDEEGNMNVKKEGDLSTGGALMKSAASTFFENQSEMIFNAFRPANKVMKAVDESLPGGVNEFMNRVQHSSIGQLYHDMKTNPTFVEAAKRAQFHGIGEEYLEEVYNNFANVAMGEMTMNELTGLETNINTFLGLAPTQVVFAAIGLGGLAAERYSTQKKLNRLYEQANEEQKSRMDELRNMSHEYGNADIAKFIQTTLADESLSPEEKRNEIDYAYNVAKGIAMEEVQEDDIQDAIKAETDDIVLHTDPSTGIYTEMNRLSVDSNGDPISIPGRQVGSIGDCPIWIQEGVENIPENRIVLKPEEIDQSSIQSMPADDVVAATEQMIRQEAEEKAEREGKFSPEIEEPYLGMSFELAGNNYQLTQQNPDGGWLAQITKKDENGKDIVSVEQITDDQYYELRQADIDAKEETEIQAKQKEAKSAPVVEEKKASETTEQAKEKPQQSVNGVVMLEDGTPDLVASGEDNALTFLRERYKDKTEHKVEVTRNAYNKDLVKAQKELDKAQEAFDEAPFGREDQAEKKLQEAQAAFDAIKAESDFWGKLHESLKSAQEQPGEDVAEEIRAMGEPMTADEYAAMALASGAIHLLRDDYIRETGYSAGDAGKVFGIFRNANNGGMTISKAGEWLVGRAKEEGYNFFDENDPNSGRNVLLEVLSSAATPKDLTNYIANRREEQARREQAAEFEYYEQLIEKEFHMSVDDYNSYIERMEKENPYDNVDITELDAIFAESEEAYQEYLLKQQEYEQGRTNQSAEGSNIVLPSAQTGESGGNTESQEERGATEAGVQVGSYNAAAQEAERSVREEINPVETKVTEQPSMQGKVAAAVSENGASSQSDANEQVVETENTEEEEEKALAKRVTILEGEESEVEVPGGTEYHQSISISSKDGKSSYVVDKVDTPDAKGNYTGSSYQYDGKSFGGVKEVVDYIDNQPAKKEAVVEKPSVQTKIEAAEAETNTDPTEAQRKAGNYKMGHVQIGNFDISIENPAGSERKGIDAKGNPWSTKMANTYGYMRGTEGVDGDHIDVFLSNDMDAWNGRKVFVVDQYNEDGTFDEHKVMLGFNEQEDAEAAYFANYEKDWGKKHKTVVTPVNLEDFEKWIDSSHRKTKAFAEYKSIKDSGESSSPIVPRMDGYTIETRKDTRDNSDLFAVKFDERVSRDEFKGQKEIAKKFGGYWSNFGKKGFLFKSEESAHDFAETVMGRTVEEVEDEAPISIASITKKNDPNAAEYNGETYNIGDEVILNGLRGKVVAINRWKCPVVQTEHSTIALKYNGTDDLSHYIESEKETPNNKANDVSKPEDPYHTDEERAHYEELKKRMRAKLNQLNSGIDPELLEIGVEMAFFHFKGGMRHFADFCKTMIEDCGDKIRPHLKMLYNAAAGTEDFIERGWDEEMDDRKTVRDFDVYNFDKSTVDVIETAQHVVEEAESMQQGEQIVEQIKNERNEEKRSERKQEETDTAALASEAETVASEAEATAGSAALAATESGPIEEHFGFKIGNAVFYTPFGKKTAQKATIYDFEKFDGRPVLDTGLAPILYEVVEWSQVAPIESKESKIMDTAPLEEAVKKVDEQLEKVNKQLALLGYYEAEAVEKDYNEAYGYMRNAEKKAVKDVKLLFDKLVKDLGLEDIVASKKSASKGKKGSRQFVYSNIAPIGGDICMNIPLNDDVELCGYFNLSAVERDNLQLDGIMYRIEQGGNSRSNNFINSDATYNEMLRAFRYVSKKWLPLEDLVSMASRIAEQETDSKKDTKNKKGKVTQQTVIGDLFGNLNTNNESKNNEQEVQLQPGSSTSKREGGHQPRQNEPVGESKQDEAERTDGRGMGGRDSGHSVSDEKRSGSLSGVHKSEQSVESKPKNVHNNVAERGHDYAPKGERARVEANIKAIETMNRLLEDGKSATREDMELLRRFSGWGGLGGAFKERIGDRWSAENPINKKLREIMTPEQYEWASGSASASQYFTPAFTIDTMWDIARAMGFKGGNVLEGSAGIGNILGLMPQDLSSKSNIMAVEKDDAVGQMLSLLYPDAKVEVKGFEEAKIENGSVDLAITNVPFVTGLKVFDTSGDNDLSRKFRDIHNFCIAKNIRKLREGGIGIFISSSGTMDRSPKLMNWITNEGKSDVVGAFRLHSNTFGGTNATSDIIVVRKRVNGRKSTNAIDVSKSGVLRVVPYTPSDARSNAKPKDMALDMNQYFIDHPENMGGEMAFAFEKGETYQETSRRLYPSTDIDQDQRLSSWAKTFKSMDWETSAKQINNQEDTSIVYEDLGEGVKEGTMLLDKNGDLCLAQRGKAVPIGVNKNKVKGKTKAECFNDYKSIKDALAKVLDYQTNHEDDKGLDSLLKELNRVYDHFVKTYGYINKNRSIPFLRKDIDFPSIAALENVTEKGRKDGKKEISYSKTDVFKHRVIEKESAPKPQSVKDGIIASIYLHGRVDVPYISEQLGLEQEKVRKDIIESGLGFENPTTMDIEVSYEYLSGNVREKLNQAREANTDGRYDVNIKALEAVVPMNIPAHLIQFSLGSSWVTPKLYTDYIQERTDLYVSLTNAGGTWVMKKPYSVNNEKNKALGVHSEICNKIVYGHELIEAALQNRTISVTKVIKHYNGETETIVDKDATMACANKIDEIRQDFRDWARQKMQSDTELSQEIERVYNEQFNNFVPKEIHDEFIPEHFGGAASIVNGNRFSLREHQAKAAIRATTQPLMLAHEVGTGKTFTLITTAMEMRRLGTARKPMIVVQNATVGQFVGSAKSLYPNARILTLEDADRTAEGRKNFYAKIRYNDWDMIVVPQSVFERIPDSPEREARFIQDKIEEKMRVIEQLREASDGRDPIVRRAEKELENLKDELNNVRLKLSSPKASVEKDSKDKKREAKAKQNAAVKAQEMLDRETDDTMNFDDMGIDALLIDEAHEYKHLGFETAMQRGVKGVDPSYSKKSQGVYLKTQAVLENNNGRNVVFATGTPISNTAAEIWTFMRYLMPADVMKSYDIFYFDDFVRNFGQIEQIPEFGASGKYKEVNRFNGYTNLPELERIWLGVADTVLTKQAGGVSDKIPSMEGDKAQDVYLPQTKALRSVMKYVKKQLEAFEQMSGKEKKEHSHIPLVMYGIAKAAAVDARLVLNDAADETNSKTNETVRQTLKSLEDSKEYNGTVAIFADNYQNKQSGFNLYEDVRDKLIDKGVPADQIVIMRSGMYIKKKLEIFDKVNRGEVRVIMGSTFTLGTGVNIQERLHTLIHVDAPVRPMDYTQRNGRILRQGNLHKEWGIPVRVLRFGVEDSLDVTAYQRLKTKGAIADSIMNGKQLIADSMNNRVLEEEQDVFGDITAQLSGSEYALLKNQIEKQVKKLESRRSQWEQDQMYIHNQKPRLKGLMISAQERKSNAESFLKKVEGIDDVVIHVGKLQFKNINAMADYIKDYNSKQREVQEKIRSGRDDKASSKLTVTIGGFAFDIDSETTKDIKYTASGMVTSTSTKMRYTCKELGLIDVPVDGQKLKNAINDILDDVLSGNDFREIIETSSAAIQRYEEGIKQLEAREGKPFEDAEALEQAKAKLEEYDELMKKELEEKEAKYAEIDSEVEEATEVVAVEEEEEEEEEGDEDTLYRGDDLEEVNERFNEELERYERGELNSSEHLSLGYPQSPVTQYFMPNKEIILLQKVLTKGRKKHHLSTSEMRNLPKSMSEPIFVFKSGPNKLGMLLSIKADNGKNIFVAIDLGITKQLGHEFLEINDITSIHDRDVENIVLPIVENDSLKYADKKKGLNWLSSAKTNSQAITKEVLSHATKIVKEFENPNIGDENLQRGGDGSFSDEELSYENDPVAKWLGESKRSKNQQQEYAQRMREHMVERAQEMAEQLHLDNLEIVTDTSALEGRKARAKGWFSKSTGKIVVVIPNNKSVADVEQTILHEAVAHYGLRKLFGKHFDEFLMNVYKNAEQEVKDRIVELAKNRGWKIDEAIEEYLASLAEDTNFEDAVHQGWFDRIKLFFIRMLAKAGVKLNVELGDNELRYILWRSYENLAEPGRYRSTISEAEDIYQQYKLKVGNYAEGSPRQDTAAEDLSFRDGNGKEEVVSDGTREAYEAAVTGNKFRAQEGFQDSMLSLKRLQDVIEKKTDKIKSFENAYMAENQMSSKNTAECEKYGKNFFKPMMDEVVKLINQGTKYEDIIRYMYAKHGLERNEYMRHRAAEQAALKELGPKPDAPFSYDDEKFDEKAEAVDEWNKDFEEEVLRYESEDERDYSGLSSLTEDDKDFEEIARQMVSEFENKFNTDALWEKVNAATKETLRKTYESGLIGRYTYLKISKQYKNYIPLRGWDETTADEVYEYMQSEMSPLNSSLKTANGRKSMADDPLATIGNMAESAILEGNRNLMKQNLLNLAMNHPTDVLTVRKSWYVQNPVTGDWELSIPDIKEGDSADVIAYKIEEHEDRMREMQDKGLAVKSKNNLRIDYRSLKNQQREHTVVVKRNGEDYILYVNGNPRAAQAINGLTNPNREENNVLASISKMNRWLAANFTTRNPAFVFSNLSRDLILSVSAVAVKEDSAYTNKFAKNIPSAMRIIARNLAGKGDSNNAEDRMFEEFLTNGGETGYTALHNVEEYKKMIKDILKDEAITGDNHKLKNGFKATLAFFSSMNRWAEDVSRFTAYKTSREMGRTVTESVNDAKEITVNFNKKGSGAKAGGLIGAGAWAGRSLYLFFNAAVQSLVNFGRLAKKNKKGFLTLLGSFSTAGFLAPMLNQALIQLLGGDGDDYYYNNLPEWVRRNNLCIYAGSGKFITIPLPIELRAFYGLGEMAYQELCGNTHNSGRNIAFKAINQISELLPLNPLGNDGDIVSNFMPDVAKPFWQLNQNRDFTGKPIYKDTPFNKTKSEWTRVYKSTSPAIVSLAKWTNELGGGDKHKRADRFEYVMNWNPAKVEHILEGYFGGMAKTINQTAGVLVNGTLSAMDGQWDEHFSWASTPVLNRFVSSGNDDRSSYTAINRRYYELQDKFKEIQGILSGYKQEAMKGDTKYRDKLNELLRSKDFRIYQIFKQGNREMSALREIEKMLPESSDEELEQLQNLAAQKRRKIVELIDGE